MRVERRVGTLAAVFVLAAFLAGGCGTPPPVPAASPSAAGATPGPTVATPGATRPATTPEPTPTLEPGATPGRTATPEPTPTLPAIVDRSLLAVLPEEVAGSPVEEDVDGERAFGADPGGTVRRYAAAVVGDAGENIAAASIAVVDPADMAAFFPAWRADYDEAACEANEGVGGMATAIVGGRTVESTTCVGDVRLYHLRLRDDALLVSITSIGPDDLGLKLIEGLRE